MKQTAEPVVHDPQHKSKIIGEIHKYLEMIIIVVIVIIVVIAGLVINKYRDDHKIVYGNSCTVGTGATLMREASSELNPNNVSKLLPTAYKILTLRNYTKDPNCTYVLTTLYINLHDKTDAQKYLTELDERFDGHNVSSLLTKHMSVSVLRSKVSKIKPEVEGIP